MTLPGGVQIENAGDLGDFTPQPYSLSYMAQTFRDCEGVMPELPTENMAILLGKITGNPKFGSNMQILRFFGEYGQTVRDREKVIKPTYLPHNMGPVYQLNPF